MPSDTPNPAPQPAAPAAAPAPGAPAAPAAPAAGTAPAAAKPAVAGAAAPAAASTTAAAPAAKPAAKPAPPAKNVASPNAPRPGVVFGGIASVPDMPASHPHKVQPGDTFASLAKDYFGDRKKADKIRAANPTLAAGAEPAPGTVVKIPKG